MGDFYLGKFFCRDKIKGGEENVQNFMLIVG